MAKNLVQMSINGVLYDIRDQRMTTKLDYIHASLTQALEHKQDLATAVVTDNDSVNWIGRLTSGSTSAVTRYKDDYIDTITGPADTHIHSLWFSMGPITYDPADKDNKELEQQRAWSKSFGVEFQELTKKPRILGLDDEDRKAEINIYGKSLHTEYIDSPLGINYIHPDKVEAIEHNIIGLPQSIPELDCLQWLYYGKRDNETNTTPLLENINIIGNASAITNIALWDFFQKEDNNYYRVLSEERIANKQIDKNLAAQNAYKIVTLDENGIIPDIFLGELKSNPLNIGNVRLIDNNNQFIIKNDNVTGDNFVIAIQPSETDTDTTKLTQTTINTKDITASNITVSDTTITEILQVNEDATITGKVSANSAEITGKVSASSLEATSINASNIQITNKADIQTLDVKGDTTVTGTLNATYLDAVLDLSARNAFFSKDIQAKNATIANLTTSTPVSSTKAVGYNDTGKLIPIAYSDATQSSAGLMSAADKKKLDDLEKYTKKYKAPDVTSETTRYIKLGTFGLTDRINLNCRITGDNFDDIIDINILSGNLENTSVFGHYSTKSKRTLGIRVSGTFSQAIEIFLKINQLTTATVEVAVDKIYQSRISISMGGLGQYDTVLTDISFSNYNGMFSSNIDIPGNLTIKNSADITLSSFGQEALSVGSSTASNLGINANNIQARNNYSAATLYLNKKGGDVHIGEGIFSNNGKNYSGTADKTVNDITIDIPLTIDEYNHDSHYVIPLYRMTAEETGVTYHRSITGFFSFIPESGEGGNHIKFEAGHSDVGYNYAYLDKDDLEIGHNSWVSFKTFQYNGIPWMGLHINGPQQYYIAKMTITYCRYVDPKAFTCILYNSEDGIKNEEIYNSIQDIPSSWWRPRTINNPTTFTQNITAPVIQATTNFIGNVTGNADYAKNMYHQNLDLSALDKTKFYPLVCYSANDFAEVAICSESAGGSAEYNQNRIHFDISTRGWRDLLYTLNIREYACHDNNEITIGCIGRGLHAGGWALWLRGGLTYSCFTRDCNLSLKTSDYTYGAEIYTVGTNYYGGTNANVEVIFTPQSTITEGAYSTRQITAPNIKANSKMVIPIGAPSSLEDGCIWIER